MNSANAVAKRLPIEGELLPREERIEIHPLNSVELATAMGLTDLMGFIDRGPPALLFESPPCVGHSKALRGERLT